MENTTNDNLIQYILKYILITTIKGAIVYINDN